MLVFFIIVNVLLIALAAYEFHKADTAEGENALIHLPAAFLLAMAFVIFNVVSLGIYFMFRL